MIGLSIFLINEILIFEKKYFSSVGRPAGYLLCGIGLCKADQLILSSLDRKYEITCKHTKRRCEEKGKEEIEMKNASRRVGRNKVVWRRKIPTKLCRN